MFLQVSVYPRAPGAKPNFPGHCYLADVSIWRNLGNESTTPELYLIRGFFSSLEVILWQKQVVYLLRFRCSEGYWNGK